MKSANDTGATCLKGERLSYWLTKKKKKKSKTKEKGFKRKCRRWNNAGRQAATEQLTGASDSRSSVIKHPAQLVHSQVGINQSQLINPPPTLPPSPKRFVSLLFRHVSTFSFNTPLRGFCPKKKPVGERRKMHGRH